MEHSQTATSPAADTQRPLARSVEHADDVCVLAWVIEDGDVVILDVKHRF